MFGLKLIIYIWSKEKTYIDKYTTALSATINDTRTETLLGQVKVTRYTHSNRFTIFIIPLLSSN